MPRDREALEALPGVGRKTANVVLNTAFGESTIAVDFYLSRREPHEPRAGGERPPRRGRARARDAGRVPATRTTG